MKLKHFMYKLRVTPLARLTKYVNILEESVKISDSADREKVDFLLDDMKKASITIRVFSSIRLFFYLILYASIITSIGQVFFTREVTRQLLGISVLIGTTFSAGMVLVLTNMINMYLEHIRITTSHMISIYAKYDNGENKKLKEYINALI